MTLKNIRVRGAHGPGHLHVVLVGDADEGETCSINS